MCDGSGQELTIINEHTQASIVTFMLVETHVLYGKCHIVVLLPCLRSDENCQQRHVCV